MQYIPVVLPVVGGIMIFCGDDRCHHGLKGFAGGPTAIQFLQPARAGFFTAACHAAPWRNPCGNGHALVLFSGGQIPPSVRLGAAALRPWRPSALTGQRHRVELQARQEALAALRRFQRNARLGRITMIDLAVLGQISDNGAHARHRHREDGRRRPAQHLCAGRNPGCSSSWPPPATGAHCNTLERAACARPITGYPDCRDDTLKAPQVAVSPGMGQRFTIETPLMWLDKGADLGS